MVVAKFKIVRISAVFEDKFFAKTLARFEMLINCHIFAGVRQSE